MERNASFWSYGISAREVRIWSFGFCGQRRYGAKMSTSEIKRRLLCTRFTVCWALARYILSGYELRTNDPASLQHLSISLSHIPRLSVLNNSRRRNSRRDLWRSYVVSLPARGGDRGNAGSLMRCSSYTKVNDPHLW